MAALTFYACSAVTQLCDLTAAFVRTGFSLSKSFRYLRAKEQRILFCRYCRDVWQQESIRCESIRRTTAAATTATTTTTTAEEVSSKVPSESAAASVKVKNFVAMKRGGLDFAAIEASMEAREAVHTYAARQRSFDSDEVAAARAVPHNFETLENYDDIEVISGLEVDTAFYEYIDTRPVYENQDIGSLSEGVSFTIYGYIQVNCERFSINFIIANQHRDVALHINPRLPQNYIVRNTKVRNVWNKEEVGSTLPFKLNRGSKFAIQVLVTDAEYLISVNGFHFAKYQHRLPYTAVSAIEVNGDVDNVGMERHVVTEYPDRLPEAEAKDIRLGRAYAPVSKSAAAHEEESDNDEVDGTSIPRGWAVIRVKHTLKHIPSNFEPTASLLHMGLSMPYNGRLPPKSLVPGRCLKIEGRIKLLPHSFYINLQQGQHFWPHPKIAFHFNPRFSKQSGAAGQAIVCRNAWYDGKWATEERSELDTDLNPGKTFSLAIVCTPQAFEVYVNRKYITSFNYHLQPDIVDTVYIQGDIKLWDVKLDNNISLKRKSRIYQNPGYTEND